ALAGAVVTGQHDALAGVHDERHAIDGTLAAVAFGGVAQLYGDWCHGRFSYRSQVSVRGGTISGALSSTPPGSIAGHCDSARRAPEHLVDDAVGTVGSVADAIAVQVKGAVVAPEIAAPVGGPLQVARANVLHLVLVVDEGVAVNHVALCAGGEMHADLAVME